MAYISQSATNTQGMNYEALVYCKTNIGGYFFDGFISIDHTISTQITEHPVETGASIVDHAYVKPAELAMTIIVSDVHGSIVPGQFSGSSARHINAWNLLKQIQADRIPVSVLTKLGLYDNMLIERLSTTDNFESYNSLKADVVLREIPVARVRTLKISASPQVTNSSNLPEVNPSPVNISSLKTLFGGN